MLFGNAVWECCLPEGNQEMIMQSLKVIQDQLRESAQLKLKLAEEMPEKLLAVAEELTACLKSGKKILLCGNGGSAADAQHLAAELVGRFRKERRALAALALTTDTSILSAVGNDFSFEEVFSRQVEALGNAGDVLAAISTSGASKNVLAAIRKAKSTGLRTIALLGNRGGQMAALVDHAIIVPSSDAQRIQECHITIGHILCELVESSIVQG
jgi:D-sedoheptulose 7-phosphate isomerase